MAFDAGALVAKLRLDTKGFKSGVERAIKQTKGMEKQALSLSNVLGKTLAIGALGALAIGFKKTVDAAGKFEKSMANVATLVDTAVVDVNELSEAVLEMTTVVTKSADDLSAGLYQVFSAGVTDAAEAMQVLEVSAIAATAGLADTRTSVDAITTIINAYGLEAKEATDISDLMFQTVKLGKTTFAELASSIGTVIAPAASLGIKLEDLFSAMATLTKGGFDTKVATTALRATFLSILKPTDDAKQTAKELGLEWSAAALKAKGLITFLNEMKEATGGNTETMAKLIPETRALNAVLALTGAQSEELNTILGQMEDRLGATRGAFEKQEDTYEAQAQKLGLLVDRIQIRIGKVFIPAINTMLKATLNLFDVVGDELESFKRKLSAPLPKIDSLDQMKIAAKEIGTTFEKLTEQDMPKFEAKLKELFGTTIPKLTNDMKEHIEKALKALRESNTKAAKNVVKSWETTSEKVKNAFESLGVVSKFQFEAQVKDQIKAFKTIVDEQNLSDQEILKLRETLFENLNAIADKAEAEGILGVDVEKFKSELAKVHQDVIDKSFITAGSVEELGDTTTVTLKGWLKSSFQLAKEAITGIEKLVSETTKSQVTAFSTITEQLDKYKSAYITAEEAITDVVVEQTEERLNVISRFVDGTLQQFSRLPITPFGGATFGPPVTAPGSDIAPQTTNNISQSVNINNTGAGSVEQGQDTIRALNQMNASMSF